MDAVTVLWVLVVATLAVAVTASVSAARFTDEEHRRAGSHRLLWMLVPAAGTVVFFPLGLGAAAAWFVTYKPRVLAARDNPEPPR